MGFVTALMAVLAGAMVSCQEISVPVNRPGDVGCPVDLAILMDVSGSICEDRAFECKAYLDMKQFVIQIIRGIKVGERDARIALITFGSDARIEFNLNRFTNKDAIIEFIERMKYEPEQTTMTDHAIRLMMNEVFVSGQDRSDVENKVLIVTDGLPTDPSETFYQADQAKKISSVFAVGVGFTTEESIENLRKLSSEPQQENRNYFLSKDFMDVDQFIDDVQYGTCSLDCKFDLIIMMDRSGSICNNMFTYECDTWNSMIRFLGDLINEINIIGDDGVRVALMFVDSEAKLMWNLDVHNNKEDLLRDIEALRSQYIPYHTTNLEKGFKMVQSNIQRTSANRLGVLDVILLVSDGQATLPDHTKNEAANIRSSGNVKIYCVGVGYSPEREILRELSSPPRAHRQNYYMSLESVEEPKLIASMEVDACGQISNSELQNPPSCETDVVFLLDISHGLCENNDNYDQCANWVQMIDFTKDVIENLDVGPASVRVGMILFGTFIYRAWPLSSGSDKDSLLDAVSQLKYRAHQMTYTASALRHMREMFAADYRPNAKKVGIVVTHSIPESQREIENVVPMAWEAANDGIQVLPVGVRTRNMEKYFLMVMSGRGRRSEGRDYFTVGSFKDLRTVTDKVSDISCRKENLVN